MRATYYVSHDEQEYQIVLEADAGIYTIYIQDRIYRLNLVDLDRAHYSALIDNMSYDVYIDAIDEQGSSTGGRQYTLTVGDRQYVLTIQTERAHRLASMATRTQATSTRANVTAPMPGLVRSIAVSAGDTVVVGQHLLALEAMKMENEIRSPQAGIVRQIAVEPGQAVNRGQLLVVIGSADDG